MRDMMYPLSEYLSNEELYFIFCCQTAYQMAPFGYSTCIKLKEMLEAERLNCGNYGFLAVRLAQSGVPDILKRNQIHFIGWDHGPIGNHQTLELNNFVFLDPTTAYYALISFDQIMAREKLPESYDCSFSIRDDIDIIRLRANVQYALKNGTLEKKYLIYYWNSINDVLKDF
jgi:hypothetical protein